MEKDTVLIISSKNDVHTDVIIDKLNKIGFGDKVVRFNTEDFMTNCLLTYKTDNSYLHFKDAEKRIHTKNLISVWYRRPKEFIVDSSLNQYSPFIKEQTEAALKGFYFSTHFNSKWINPLDALYRSRLKIQQLELARKIGFNIPDTIVTNSPNELLAFLDTHISISTKSLDYPNAKVDGKLFPLYNRIIDKIEFKKNIQSIRLCPAIFQQYIDKIFDIRVIVIGDSITAFAIYSQEQDLSKIDVRGISAFDLRHEIFELPKDIVKKIKSFVKQQGLVFSAIDLLYGTDEQFYFLENNPNGQWLWLEEKTGFSLSDIFIKELYNRP